MRVPDWTPLHTTVADLLCKARDERVIVTQSGLLDGGKAAVVAAYGKEAEALMRWVRKRADDVEQPRLERYGPAGGS